ncbi:hypothetical protein OOK41_10800 [Micromonospora sp. NBC_01655]|uniref:hypothetical protein n=1 Tax=Micromonospora sp. NBC_01655 TaxID=2975983 RepID=UPI002257D84C|nr:hypothetical protein [Micromonospora sp. NBC_01655]MCX4470790.1 hypothetical protein [Micromonospora sp. NBC_01655]
MTMLRAMASALALVGGLILLLALIGLASGDLDAALAGVLGLALLAAGLVLLNRAGRQRGGYRYPATGDPAGLYGSGLYGSGTYGAGAGADHPAGGWSGDSGPGDSGGGWSGGDSGGYSGGGDSGGGGSW